MRITEITEVAGKPSPTIRGNRRAAAPVAVGILALALCLTTAFAQDGPAKKGDDAKGTLTVKGSDTMVILGQRWAQEFMKKHPDIKVQVMGGGSGTGIAALLNGSTEIAQASRPMKPKEKVEFVKTYHRRVEEIPTALDGIALFLNKNNPVDSLALDDLNRVFRGETRNWKDLGGKDAPIVLYGRENSSGTYAFFKEHILKDLDFAPETQTLPGTAAIINAVEKDPNGIGYGGIGYSEGVKVISLKKDMYSPAIAPTETNVDNGSYPLSRELYFYLDPEKNTGIVKTYIDFCLGPEGQAIVSEVGYYPLKSKKASVEKVKEEKGEKEGMKKDGEKNHEEKQEGPGKK